MKLTITDQAKLAHVDPRLRQLIEAVAATTTIPFMVLEGRRTLERQKSLYAQGHTWTLNSKHLTGHAVDIAPLEDGEPTFAWPSYYRLAREIKATAATLGIAVRWGGDWKKTKDGPHWELITKGSSS